MAKQVVVYHAGCPDGFGSAWLLRRCLTRMGHEVELVEGFFDKEPDWNALEPQSNIWVVDFCFDTDTLNFLCSRFRTVRVLDHHQTSFPWLRDSVLEAVSESRLSGSRFAYVHNQTHSGIGLVARLVQLLSSHDEDAPHIPSFVYNVEDRDLWKFELYDTHAVFAAVTARPYTLEAWDALAELDRATLITEGQAIGLYRSNLIQTAVNGAWKQSLFGYSVWVAPCPYAIGSDVAGLLALRTPDTFAAYFMPLEHGGNKWGLRSGPDGLDVAALCETMGGGGHKHAAGFEEVYIPEP